MSREAGAAAELATTRKMAKYSDFLDQYTFYDQWRRGVAVERRICDQEIAGSSLGRALRRQNSGQVSHTYVPLSPSSWYWPKGGDARRLGR